MCTQSRMEFEGDEHMSIYSMLEHYSNCSCNHNVEFSQLLVKTSTATLVAVVNSKLAGIASLKAYKSEHTPSSSII